MNLQVQVHNYHRVRKILLAWVCLCLVAFWNSANAFQAHHSLSTSTPGSVSVSVSVSVSLANDRLFHRPPNTKTSKTNTNTNPKTTVPYHTRTSTTHLQAFPATATATAAATATATLVSATATVVKRALAAMATAVRMPSTASRLSKLLTVTALCLVGVLAASRKIRHSLLWPGLVYPSSQTANDLLPGSLGCPFLGSPWMMTSASKDYGAGNSYRTMARSLGAKLQLAGDKVPKIWKYYLLGKPFAVVSGGKTFQKMLNLEFGGTVKSAGVELMQGGLLPIESILFEPDKKRHTYLRKLVGSALTPTVVAQSAGLLQSASEAQVDKMLMAASSQDDDHDNNNHDKDKPQPQPPLVKFHQVCTDYTLDVAWRQILGLQLAEDEIPIFEQQVATWIEGIMSLQVLFRYKVEEQPGYFAMQSVIAKIEERIDQLLLEGPDHTSTLSGMVFATDEEDPTKQLSREEIIANALILIFAGSETSASTLTNAMLFLGLHPTVWDRLVREQDRIHQRYGDALTIESLDVHNAPYLDAVLKETMRMRTIVGGIPRIALEEIDVDGDGQTIIPKGYLIDPSLLLTHEEDPHVKLPKGRHLDAIEGFRPERWLGQASAADHTQHPKPDSEWYVPYGFGPRYCLGKNLAQLEMKIFVATVVRKLDFPKLAMLPADYEYAPTKTTGGFDVEWSTSGSVIPTVADGVLAQVAPAPTSPTLETAAHDWDTVYSALDDDYKTAAQSPPPILREGNSTATAVEA